MTDVRLTIYEPFGGWTDEQRRAVCKWVRKHGMDPATIPADQGVHIGEDDVEFEVIQRDTFGTPILTVDTFVTAPVRTPLVASWPL